MITGTWKEYISIKSFRDALLTPNNETLQCRPWISTDGITRTNIYVDMLNYIDYYYYTSNHSIKYTQVFSGLTAIPSTQVISEYVENDYDDSSPITYTNSHFYEWDETNMATKEHIKVFMTNSTDNPITVNSFKFRKSVCISRPYNRSSSGSYANALILVYYLDTPIVIPGHSCATYTTTIKTRGAS